MVPAGSGAAKLLADFYYNGNAAPFASWHNYGVTNAVTTPEPGTLSLAAAGLLLLARRRR